MQTAYHVSGSSLKATSESEESIDADPRGLVLMFEEPKPHATYIMGGDPTVGITGWQRHLRIEGDEKTDNAALEIFRVDALKLPLWKDAAEKIPDIDPVTKVQRFVYRDLQVCEFAAPIDAVEMARVANMLGRIYAGSEDDQCEFIFESYPGPGILTTQELLRLGYMNLWYWETIADSIAEPTRSIGWHSNASTQKILWYRARRHLMERRAKIRSKYLLSEYSNAVIDVNVMRARAAYGSHDDRLQAANMCYWAGHKWCYNPERTDEEVTAVPFKDHQLAAPVLGEYVSYRDQWADAVDSWG